MQGGVRAENRLGIRTMDLPIAVRVWARVRSRGRVTDAVVIAVADVIVVADPGAGCRQA